MASTVFSAGTVVASTWLNDVNAVTYGVANIRRYGTLVNDGATDDSSIFNAAASSGVSIIDARGVNCAILAPINFTSNQVWLLDGAHFTFNSASINCFNLSLVNNVSLLGTFFITGSAGTIGTAKAIRINDCSRWFIDNPNIASIQGWGMYVEPGSSTTTRASHGTVRSLVATSCYVGYEDVAGTGAEYCTIENARITNCTTIGLKTCAGNMEINGGHIVDNVAVGVYLGAGGNSAHGIFTGVNINHNGTYGIQAVQITNGFTFNGCHTYQNDIWFDRCKGIQWNGGAFDPSHIYNYKDGSSGMNYISGAYFPGAYGPIRTVGSNDGHDQLIIDATNWGPGTYAFVGGKDTTGVSILDPTSAYVTCIRDVAASQSLTTGVAATLTYSTENYLYDRRGIQSAGTFTIPANQAGLYHIDLDLLFSGTAMSTSASLVEMKVNGVTKKVFFPSINSTTTLQIQGSFDYYFNFSDAVTFVATITGTTPTFGNATWPSNVSIRRIA